ncbi:MAG: serine hydrolase [Anaerolineae bacterium]|nr:serine hydrolase [Anaerolineae bacterium]
MLKALQRFLTLTFIAFLVLFLLLQGFLYWRGRDNMPPGTTIAGVDVSGMTAEETAVAIQKQYSQPVIIYYNDERIELSPLETGFSLNLDGMISKAQAQMAEQDIWMGYLRFVLGRPLAPLGIEPLEPIQVDLEAAHDEFALRQQIATIGSFIDQPALPPRIDETTGTFADGSPGYVADVEASLPDVTAALYKPEKREARLVILDQPAPEFDINFLADSIQKQLDAFSGVGSIFIMDLQTGEEISINADAAISGLSILKIMIFVEAYRTFDGSPNEYVAGLLYDTAVKSSNFGANLLLHEIAGESNTYRGADLLTESMHRLGLVNTFMAVPYDATAPATRRSTYVTPANSEPDLLMNPDTAMQTTAEEMGSFLSMLYYCSQGGGALLAVYPNDLTPAECQEVIDLMVLNDEGNLIRFGVPEDVPVSHKHGWDLVTHGDAGIVLSPGGAYVIVEYLSLPAGDSGDWLSHDITFPILREISRTVYNYFNPDNPNLEDPQHRAEREAIVREEAAAKAAEEAAAEAAANGEVIEDGTGTAVPTPTIDPNTTGG